MHCRSLARTWLLVCTVSFAAANVIAAESLWLEAEHFDGIKGHCWPLGRPNMKVTSGHWGLSGPGWAAEWNQGGESGFLSIATAGDDDHAVVTRQVEVPAEGRYQVWVRYGDWREKPERFQIKIEQPGGAAWTGQFGEAAVIEEDNEMKLYFGWAFGWDRREAPLKKGPATISLLTTTKDPEPRQVDVIVLTTDADYRPRTKERPHTDHWDVLASYREQAKEPLEPLARGQAPAALPEAWNLRTYKDGKFLYLWNMNHTAAGKTWLGDQSDRVKAPYNVLDERVRKEFETKYAGRDDVPIFGDPRVVPTFHGAGAAIFSTDAKTGELTEEGRRFAAWLDAHPDRYWAMMMNYAPPKKIDAAGLAAFRKYQDRYVGSVSGENLGYFNIDAKVMKEAVSGAKTRRELVAAMTPVTLAANADKYRQIYGQDVNANPYADVIACLSIDNIAFAPLCYDWGARTVGYESSAMSSSLLGMRWAFMRGAARQNRGLTTTYRSCNFGDASTLFADGQSFASHKYILDNYYSVYSGAGMTWYKMDIWYQYMAGSSMFYHEQGTDEFWKPGGTSAAGEKEVQLSPKGKLVDRFLRLTAAEPDRGQPYTPVAILVDYAHGWEPSPFWPSSFNDWQQEPSRFRYGDHEQMLEQYFWTAYYPIGPKSEQPITATNEVYVPGTFGDIFDVVYAYPDVKKWTTLDTYPVTIAAGDIELTAAEGARLKQYIEQGGTLLVAEGQFTGPGVAELGLPKVGAATEASGYHWLAGQSLNPSQRFQYRPIEVGSGRALATTADGSVCCAAFDRGKGRLVYLSVPRGLGIDRQATPLVARLFAHLTSGLMPVSVEGDVEWLVNRTASGWAVTLLNPAGQDKPQQGITPTDYRQNRPVTIRATGPITKARDRLLPTDTLTVEKNAEGKNAVRCEVPAGGVRIIEIQ